MPTLQIQLLGHFHLTYEGAPVTTVQQARLQSLLAYLALHPQTPVARQQLSFLYWPDTTEAQARANLRKALFDLRRLLPDLDSCLQVESQLLQWRDAATIQLDVAIFEGLLAQADRLGQTSSAQTLLEQAVARYTGDLLPACYDDWVLRERERLRQRYLHTLEQLVHLLEQRGAYRPAVTYAQQLLQADPLQESTYRTLMRLHLQRGDRAHALRVYHTCATVLQQELGVDPGPETQVAYQHLLTLPAVPAVTPPGPAPPAQREQLPLVGRKQEWELLQHAWRTALDGQPHLVLITGEAGIGKTRLTEELLQWAERQGYATAKTRSYAAEGRLAYAPVADWLRADAIRLQLPRLEPVWLGEIARLLPELLAEQPHLAPPQPFSESWQRQRFRQALARALQLVEHPLLLVIDDVQWCDQETLEWLHYLLRVAAQARLLVVGTVRPEEVEPDHPLVILSTNLRQKGRLLELELAPLNASETAALAAHAAGHTLDAQQAASLYGETEGHPLFVVEIMRARTGAQTALPGQAPASDLPTKVQNVIQSRLGQLTPATRELAELASTVGRAFTVDVLALASLDEEETLVRGLDELWRRRIIRELGEVAYDFNHDKLREAAYAGINAARRRLLHRRVALALEQVHAADLDAVSGQIAAHYELAGLPQEAVTYYRRTAEVAQRVYAHHEAIHYLTKGLALADRLAQAAPRIHLVQARGEVYETLGEFDKARVDQESALQWAHTAGEPHAEWQALLNLAKLWAARSYSRTGDYARRALQQARALDDRAALARSLNQLGNWHANMERPRMALRYHQEALALFQDLHDRRGLATTLDLLGNTNILSGDLISAAAYYEQAIALFQALDDRQGLASTLGTLMGCDGGCETDTAVADVPRRLDYAAAGDLMLKITSEIGWRTGEAIALSMVGRHLGARGEYARALRCAQRAVAIAEAIEHREWLAHALDTVGVIYLDLLALPAARQQLERAWVLANESGALFHVYCTIGFLASAYILQRELALAEATLAAAPEFDAEAATVAQRQVLCAQAELALARQEPALALQFVDRLIASAAHASGERVVPRLWALRGEALTALQRWSEAEEALQAARQGALAQGARPRLWRIHAALGHLYRAQARQAEAEQARMVAQSIIQELAADVPDAGLRQIFVQGATALLPHR